MDMQSKRTIAARKRAIRRITGQTIRQYNAAMDEANKICLASIMMLSLLLSVMMYLG